MRQRLLPEIAATRYAAAKAAYDRKEYAAAEQQFRDLVVLLNDPQMGAGRATSGRSLPGSSICGGRRGAAAGAETCGAPAGTCAGRRADCAQTCACVDG